jgi:peptidoglycan-N-acetylglucosamine deacetylase
MRRVPILRLLSQRASWPATVLLLSFSNLIHAHAQNAAAAQQTPAPQVAFTFDDLPAHGPLPPGMARPEVVRSILATLKHENMPPIYGFVNGFRMARYPYQIHILEAWKAPGNPLGNHTWSHPELDKVSATSYIANIARDEPSLRKVDPQGDWHWFRYPYLEEGDTLAKREAVRSWLFEHHYRIAEVSIDFEDWMWNDAYGRCSAKHDGAAIATLHDTYLATADEYIRVFRQLSHELYGRDIPYVLLLHVGAFDAKMMPELIGLFRQRGFTFITMPQALSDSAYSEDPKQPNAGGSTFLEQIAAARNKDIPDSSEPDKQLDALCR